MFVRKKDVIYWKNLEAECKKQFEEKVFLKSNLYRSQQLLSALKKKMHGTHSVIFDIIEDKDGHESYICIQDQRRPEWDSVQNICFLNGDLNVFVLSSTIAPTEIPGRLVDMPYMQSTFSMGHVIIRELHCDIDGNRYENKGYATMMINALIRVAQNSNCTSVGGRLFRGDADTDRKKSKRNGFYTSKGFTLSFSDNEAREGTFHLDIGRLPKQMEG